MKFYDKKGRQHDTLIGAYAEDIKDMIDEKLREKLAGYSDTVDAEFSDVPDDYDGSFDEILDDLASQSSNDFDPVDLDTASCGDNNSEPAASEQTASDTEVRAVIDYAHGTMEAVDGNGDVAAKVNLDYTTTKGTIDKDLMDLLYNGNPPDSVKSNIESIGRKVAAPVSVSVSENVHYTCYCGITRRDTPSLTDKCPICGSVISLIERESADSSSTDVTDGPVG